MLATKIRSALSSPVAPSVAWDLAYAYYELNDPLGAWSISNINYFNGFSVAGQETGGRGLFFKPDGSKMYVVGSAGDDVNEYSLSTAWDVSTASFIQNFPLGGLPQAISFKPDGSKMYVLDSDRDDVGEYSLSTAWDVSTASFNQSFSVAGQEITPTGLFFKPDGSKMYVIGTSSDAVHEYSLSTAWDVSTTSYVQAFSVAGQETAPSGLFFKPDGSKMYVTGITGDDVNEYSLSTAWDVSTTSYVTKTPVIAAGAPTDIFFRPDGAIMYIMDSNGNSVYSYFLGTVFSVAGQETVPQGLFFKPDGSKMYVIGSTGDDINEYSLSTAWDELTASFVQTFSVAGQETIPTDLFFGPDGTRVYVLGDTGDDVNEYSLSTAWDVSTTSYVQAFSVAGQEITPTGLFFKPDGSNMYVVGSSSDAVHEYSLSTAWDVSTASYVQAFSVAGQETVPQGLFFKPDGSKMYVLGSTGDDINEYSLSTSWDVSTASFIQTFSVAGQETVPTGLFFKPDGTRIYVTGAQTDKIFSYTIGIQE